MIYEAQVPNSTKYVFTEMKVTNKHCVIDIFELLARDPTQCKFTMPMHQRGEENKNCES